MDFLFTKVRFWQVACCATSVCFCKTDRSHESEWSRMPWLWRPKNLYGGPVYSDETSPKMTRTDERTDTYRNDGRGFSSVAHTKCPSGNNFWFFVKIKVSSRRYADLAGLLVHLYTVHFQRRENSVPLQSNVASDVWSSCFKIGTGSSEDFNRSAPRS